jgi:hypothetical protein
MWISCGEVAALLIRCEPTLRVHEKKRFVTRNTYQGKATPVKALWGHRAGSFAPEWRHKDLPAFWIDPLIFLRQFLRHAGPQSVPGWH